MYGIPFRGACYSKIFRCFFFAKAAIYSLFAFFVQFLLIFSSCANANDSFAVIDKLSEKSAACDVRLAKFTREYKSGSIDAAYWLGHSYHLGLCTEIDFDKSIGWYQVAASKGHEKAKHNLAELYISRGNREEIEKALILLKENVESGFLLSAVTLGKVFYDGVYVERSFDVANNYWRKAADREPLAKYNLANSYALGQGVDRDSVIAQKLLLDAAKKDPDAACHVCYSMVFQDHFLFKKDYKMAEKWCKKAAVQGVSSCASILGQIYVEGGFGLQSQPESGLRWIRRAADLGDVKAQFVYGVVLYKGVSPATKDMSVGRKYIESAAKAGHERAAEFIRSIEKE